MQRLILIAAVMVVSACGSAAPPLPPAGASGTVVVNVWDPHSSTPTVVVAESIRQEGVRFDRLILERLRVRAVLPDFDAAINAPSGSWSAAKGLLTLDGPVHIAGTWQGAPVLGAAASAGLSRDGQAILLERLELWHQGQRLTAPLAELRRDRTLLAPRGMDSSPLPGEWAAVMAALPDPLNLPR